MNEELLVLQDIQERAEDESPLLGLVESGEDGAVTTYYNTTIIPVDELGENVREYLPTYYTKRELRHLLGDLQAAAVFAGLRAYGQSDGTYADIVREAVIELDNGKETPDLGDNVIRGIITTLGDNNAFDLNLSDSQAVAAALLGLAQKSKLCHLVIGRTMPMDLISRALSHVRINGTIELKPNWRNLTIGGNE